ncbi:MAG: hypothetical protein HOE90_11090 [Bacteriovoracaceae bacterium]|nr:hypothetical protein [Bacteriovoracaceae bacterium]
MLILVTVTIMISGIFSKLKAFLIGEGDCPNDSYICRVIDYYQSPGYFDGSYRYFSVQR